MSSRTEVAAKVVSNTTYNGAYVKELIHSITCENQIGVPDFFKRGDMIRVRINQETNKPRPSVVIKATKEYVVSIPLTSSEDINALCASTGSRFFKDCFFCNNYVITPLERARENYLGIYDSSKSLNNAVKELKHFINQNI